MKRIIAILICLCCCLPLIGCSGNEQIDNSSEGYYDRTCIDITTKGNGYYSMIADVMVGYHNGDIGYIIVDNPTLLSFKVSDKYDGGVYLISGAEYDQIVQYLLNAKENTDDEVVSDYIDYVLNILQTKGVYDYCHT